MEKKYKKYLPFVATAVISAIIFFYGGMKYGEQGAAGGRLQSQQMRGQRSGGFQTAGGFVTGQVLSKDAQSITVQARDGSSRIVLYSSSTSVVKSVAGSLSDISAGAQVTVQGTQNSDGSVTAQTIQVREDQARTQ
ncbi:MAG TPA: DUF5666 domain-containing protein [Candidatus Paceibacterota bacterium]|nr:DUF5666 domain-containing protein [Candidatus Paceibacterota bacterium]